jgi:hypothetical protein
MLVTSVSFFNEVSIETKNYPRNWFHFLTSLKSENHAQRPLFHLLTRLPQRRKNYPRKWFHFLTSLKSENHAQRPLFHFLTRLPQRRKKYPQSIFYHGFQEDNAPEGDHVKGQNSVMASKRNSFDGRNTLWKDTMSRVTTGVKRSGSNNPIEEITMSTTGSKSSEVEAMGDNAT